MQGAAILAPEGRGDPLLAIEDGSQAGPAGAFSLLAEASADCLHHLVGDHGDEQGDYKETLTLSNPSPTFRVSEGRVEMAKNAPGKAHREGLTVVELMDMFPTEEAATKWFESIIWPDGRHCLKCGSVRTREASHKYMPYWCTDCRSYFS